MAGILHLIVVAIVGQGVVGNEEGSNEQRSSDEMLDREMHGRLLSLDRRHARPPTISAGGSDASVSTVMP